MRHLGIAAALVVVLVAPAGADPIRESFPLRYVPATEFAQMLRPVDPVSGSGGLGSPAFVPKGLAAWTVDAVRNALVVVGEPAAIEQVRQYVRLIDVPPAEVELHFEVLRFEPAKLTEILAGRAAGEPHPDRVLRGADLLSAEMIGSLRKGATGIVLASQMAGSNNRPVHLQWERGAESVTAIVELTPRVNGDRSVTLLSGNPSSRRAVGAPTGKPVQNEALGLTVHRLNRGDVLGLTTNRPNELLLIRVEKVTTGGK